jgi:hypothetical protein
MKPFTTVAVVVFSLITVVHLLRLFFHWQVTINGVIVPIWVSIPGFIITGVLAIMLLREAKKKTLLGRGESRVTRPATK